MVLGRKSTLQRQRKEGPRQIRHMGAEGIWGLVLPHMLCYGPPTWLHFPNHFYHFMEVLLVIKYAGK